MKYRQLIFVAIIALAWACEQKESGHTATLRVPKPTSATKDQAQLIVDQVIDRHGGELFFNSIIKFTFRDRQYKATRRGASFEYERAWTDSTGQHIRDILNNGGLYREVNGRRVALNAKDSSAYANALNSVLYFALLPALLNDPAVVKSYLGEMTVKNQPYHKVKVTFQPEGGGKDFQDEYVYWFHRDSLTMDYLAYNFQVDGGGARFREAYRIRTVNGIRFADYINYKPQDPANRAVETFDRLLERGALEEISRIDLENVEVILLNQ